jgi:hypothetical protein
MKKTKKATHLVLGLVLVMSMAFGSTVDAAPTKRTLEATFNNIKLVVDGTAVTPKDAQGNTIEPFLVDGVAYLPVYAVADLLGKDTEWNASTNTITIKDKPPVSVKRTLLSELTPLQRSGNDAGTWTANHTDNFGNKYTNGYRFGTAWSSNPSFTFAVTEYNSLTVTITPSSTANNASVKLVFYSMSDTGSRKILETADITPLTRPFTITVPLDGVNNLMIERQRVGQRNVGLGLVDAYLE